IVDGNAEKSGVYNLGPCPLPGGKVMFTSNRDGFVPTKSYAEFAVDKKGYIPATTLQLFVMDDNGSNVELVGHLNINGALHPTILRDGRVMFSTFETEGMRDVRMWAVWTINPDGTHWSALFSAMGASGETARHFMTQLSDGDVVLEEYYFQRNMGFGTFFKAAASALEGQPFFGSASHTDPRNLFLPKRPEFGRIPFSPFEAQELTKFSHFSNEPAYLFDPNDPKSPRVGKVTQPSGAPDDNLLLVYSPGPVYGISLQDKGHEFAAPAIHSGIYMIKGGKPIDEPGQMLLIKNDPNYNEQWPRALVPYKHIYGVDEPSRISSSAYPEDVAKKLPEGAPFGMVGSASLYKRESYPAGEVPQGKVTAQYSGGNDPFLNLGTLSNMGLIGNWFEQGADDGKYSNDDIHAIRILITEPTTDPHLTRDGTRRWWNASDERLRILGEFPVRKFNGDQQPIDPDGNPDTSFLVKLPADVAWTFQTLDKNGMVLNMAQTWHQLRPGEVRTDCGGCHAHSQVPTLWDKTGAAQPDYPVFDLTKSTPLLTTKEKDESHRKWDVKDETGLRFDKGVKDVEYFRDIKPILDRSCVSCHTQKWAKPAGNLVLDDNMPMQAHDHIRSLMLGRAFPKVPGTYFRLAMDYDGKFGYPLDLHITKSDKGGWVPPQASRYIRYFQSRRSLLVWKIYGRRMDGFSNDDFAYETKPGDPNSAVYKGKPFVLNAGNTPFEKRDNNKVVNLVYLGEQMPPPEAVEGTYKGPDGKTIKVPALTDEDRRTIVRWIDMGCPIDLDFDPAHPKERRHGWMADDNRPTLVLAYPRPDANTSLSRILVGMQDDESGLDMTSFKVTANMTIDGIPSGQNLASKFKPKSQGVWELTLNKPITKLANGKLTVSVKDEQGNLTQINRAFSVAPEKKNRVTQATVGDHHKYVSPNRH
ncbi:MAG: hypothetical protein ACRD2O_08915, partial [Terriglobia bacterium]